MHRCLAAAVKRKEKGREQYLTKRRVKEDSFEKGIKTENTFV